MSLVCLLPDSHSTINMYMQLNLSITCSWTCLSFWNASRWLKVTWRQSRIKGSHYQVVVRDRFCCICNSAPPSQCTLCPAAYSEQALLEDHMKTHRELPCCCTVCGSFYPDVAALAQHARTHRGQKVYECSHCEKAFGMLQTLKVHLRTHTNERPYVCMECGEAFSLEAALMRHSRLRASKPGMEDATELCN
jgi:uncharacterized Zn-finger protein